MDINKLVIILRYPLFNKLWNINELSRKLNFCIDDGNIASVTQTYI
jgi:hypothetical protein